MIYSDRWKRHGASLAIDLAKLPLEEREATHTKMENLDLIYSQLKILFSRTKS